VAGAMVRSQGHSRGICDVPFMPALPLTHQSVIHKTHMPTVMVKVLGTTLDVQIAGIVGAVTVGNLCRSLATVFVTIVSDATAAAFA